MDVLLEKTNHIRTGDVCRRSNVLGERSSLREQKSSQRQWQHAKFAYCQEPRAIYCFTNRAENFLLLN